MNESFTIRSATAADVATIVHHRRAMFEDMQYANREELDVMEARFSDWVRIRLERGEYKGWFVMAGEGEIVASAGLWLTEGPPHPTDPQRQRGNILNVYTLPAFRRQGMARHLMDFILDWCRANQIRTLVLYASTEGRSLYESLGFKPTNEMRMQL